jgi:hypothetical protein
VEINAGYNALNAESSIDFVTKAGMITIDFAPVGGVATARIRFWAAREEDEDPQEHPEYERIFGPETEDEDLLFVLYALSGGHYELLERRGY